MKSPQVLIALSVLLLAVGVPIWGCVHTFSPAPETESAFLKNYTPTNVLKRFDDGQASYSSGRGSGAGYESVTHTAMFDESLFLCSEKFMPLMDALSDDVAAQLVGNGARILSQIGVAQAGFHFDYKLGKTVGSVTISPLELTPLLTQTIPRPNCMVGVHTRIDVAEQWSPKEPGLVN
jgi:hypothetical protein